MYTPLSAVPPQPQRCERDHQKTTHEVTTLPLPPPRAMMMSPCCRWSDAVRSPFPFPRPSAASEVPMLVKPAQCNVYHTPTNVGGARARHTLLPGVCAKVPPAAPNE